MAGKQGRSSILPFHRLLELLDGSHPEHLHGRSGAVHLLGHLVEGKPLEVPEHDHFLVVGRQFSQCGGDAEFVVQPGQLLAGGRIGGGGLGGSEGVAGGRIAEGDLAADLTLGGASIVTNEIGHVMGQDLSQPGEPLLFRIPLEAVEIAMGLEHRLLYQVRGIDLCPQPTLDLRPGGEAKIAAAQLEESIAALGVPCRARSINSPIFASFPSGMGLFWTW